MLKRKTICLSAIMVLFLVVPGLADTFSGRVVAVTDGDTIKVMHQGGPNECVCKELIVRKNNRPSGSAPSNSSPTWLWERK